MPATTLVNRLPVPGSRVDARAASVQRMMRLPTLEAAKKELAAYRPRDALDADYAHIALGLRATLSDACDRVASPVLCQRLANTSQRTIIALAKQLSITIALLDQRQEQPMVVADPAWDRSPYNPQAVQEARWPDDERPDAGDDRIRDPMQCEEPAAPCEIPATDVDTAETVVTAPSVPGPPVASAPGLVPAGAGGGTPTSHHAMHRDGPPSLAGHFAAGDALSRLVSRRLDHDLPEHEAWEFAMQARGARVGAGGRRPGSEKAA